MTEEATEFVALTEERIEKLAGTLGPYEELRVAAQEASENTRRWLMERVCRDCMEVPEQDDHRAIWSCGCGPYTVKPVGLVTRAEAIRMYEDGRERKYGAEWLSRQEEGE